MVYKKKRRSKERKDVWLEDSKKRWKERRKGKEEGKLEIKWRVEKWLKEKNRRKKSDGWKTKINRKYFICRESRADNTQEEVIKEKQIESNKGENHKIK